MYMLSAVSNVNGVAEAIVHVRDWVTGYGPAASGADKAFVWYRICREFVPSHGQHPGEAHVFWGQST